MEALQILNMVKKHARPTQDNPQGGIIEKEMPIHISNLAFYDSSLKKGVKLGLKFSTPIFDNGESHGFSLYLISS